MSVQSKDTINLQKFKIWDFEEKYHDIGSNSLKPQKTTLSKKLENIISSINDFAIIAITDKEGWITFVNEKFCKISKYSKEELLGQNHRMLKSGYHSPLFYKEMWKTITSGKVWEGQIKNKAKDGTFYWVKTVIVPFLDETGNPYEYVSLRVDITSQKNVEEQLKNMLIVLSKTQKYRNVYENSSDLLRSVSENGIILDCNKAYAEHFGYSKDEIIGTSIFDAVDEKDVELMKQVNHEWKQDGLIVNKEIFLKKKNGIIFPALISATKMYDEEKNIMVSNTIIKDITEIYEARKKIIENQEKIKEHVLKLQAMDIAKNEFMTMVTHELKNPLVPILCYTNILLQEKFGPLNKYQRKRLEMVKSSAETLKKITAELLDIQKMGFGNLKLDKKTSNMTQIVQYAIESFQPDAESKRIKITSELKKDVSCFCDELRINQVLSNIISNAIDFCPSKNGKIHLSLDSDENWVTISIKDNGIGIPKEKIEKVFEKFYQVDTTIIRRHGGTGIGLSFCKGVVENHNGKISIESDLGQGCQVYIKIPPGGENLV